MSATAALPWEVGIRSQLDDFWPLRRMQTRRRRQLQLAELMSSPRPPSTAKKAVTYTT